MAVLRCGFRRFPWVSVAFRGFRGFPWVSVDLARIPWFFDVRGIACWPKLGQVRSELAQVGPKLAPWAALVRPRAAGRSFPVRSLVEKAIVTHNEEGAGSWQVANQWHTFRTQGP